MHVVSIWLTVCAVFTGGLLAGISLDKALVQLPARARIGNAAYADFSRAADLAAGLFWYPLLGILAPALAIAATVFVLVQRLPWSTSLPAYLAAGLAAFYVFTTSRAAPKMVRLRASNPDEAALAQTFKSFERWHRVRFAGQLAAFISLLWSLVELIR
jgi:hypothetical protein